MVTHALQASIRTATKADTQSLANLVHFEQYVHRHLDWRPPLEWIGHAPYLVAERNRNIIAALASPPDPPNIAWIRLFAVRSDFSPKAAWEELWPEALATLEQFSPSVSAAAIPMQSWFRKLLEFSGFNQTHKVVVLAWRAGVEACSPGKIGAIIRPMNLDDLSAVEDIDMAAFGAVWQNTLSCLELAYRQAAIATVAETEGKLVGYQISTATTMGGHLARLAVTPAYQGRGIGYSLLCDMLAQFERRGAYHVTVNTQHDNLSSLSLYQKAGFRRTGEEYPVYQYYPLLK
ncbi:MAG: GNAT family N-acetyltransferase [Anaerolineales bacterium]|nr:MAG: GNAT family N-acetyltransferase [Anaerolineales bacterium]